jgi:hypothetical protein
MIAAREANPSRVTLARQAQPPRHPYLCFRPRVAARSSSRSACRSRIRPQIVPLTFVSFDLGT